MRLDVFHLGDDVADHGLIGSVTIVHLFGRRGKIMRDVAQQTGDEHRLAAARGPRHVNITRSHKLDTPRHVSILFNDTFDMNCKPSSDLRVIFDEIERRIQSHELFVRIALRARPQKMEYMPQALELKA